LSGGERGDEGEADVARRKLRFGTAKAQGDSEGEDECGARARVGGVKVKVSTRLRASMHFEPTAETQGKGGEGERAEVPLRVAVG